MIKDQFINTYDMGNTILEYIGSEDYEKAVASTQDSGRAGFMAGVAMAVCVIMARCKKYYGQVNEPDEEDEA